MASLPASALAGAILRIAHELKMGAAMRIGLAVDHDEYSHTSTEETLKAWMEKEQILASRLSAMPLGKLQPQAGLPPAEGCKVFISHFSCSTDTAVHVAHQLEHYLGLSATLGAAVWRDASAQPAGRLGPEQFAMLTLEMQRRMLAADLFIFVVPPNAALLKAGLRDDMQRDWPWVAQELLFSRQIGLESMGDAVAGACQSEFAGLTGHLRHLVRGDFGRRVYSAWGKQKWSPEQSVMKIKQALCVRKFLTGLADITA